ncbi:hypothetical protein [Thiorhodovibrio litoralis]|uniref:hypothetical protein n=1 Tax=Thiorhodovibrio litoralis TaxID=2952932 RepID=UPI002B25E6A4|nr:hypothetical protein [Thiorhodovibrio litoralis]WPL11554.1 hypothetical protein Thiosp_01303 [Thiorhodovibrio litoralis]
MTLREYFLERYAISTTIYLILAFTFAAFFVRDLLQITRYSIPIENGLVLMFLFAFYAVGFRYFRPKVILGQSGIDYLIIFWLILMGAAVLIGILRGGNLLYVAAYTAYSLSFLAMYFLTKNIPLVEICWPCIGYREIGVLLLSYFVFSSDTSVTFLVLAMFFLVAINGATRKLKLASVLGLLGALGGFSFSVNLTRATLLSFLVFIFIYFLMKKKYLPIFIFILGSGAVVFGAQFINADHLNLSRNIREGLLILQGDPISYHPSTYQRIWEAEHVNKLVNDLSGIERFLGYGFGKTVDMSGALAASEVMRNAFGGESKSSLLSDEVHNIHFLHSAFLLRHGYLGVLTLAALVAVYLRALFFSLISKKCPSNLYIFAVSIGLGQLAYGWPASNFFFANPIVMLSLGIIAQRGRAR